MDNPFQTIMERLEAFGDKLDRAIGQAQNEHGLDRFKYLRIEDAANRLGVKVSTMYTYTRKRKLRHYKRGTIIYFNIEDLNEFVEKGRIESKMSHNQSISRT